MTILGYYENTSLASVVVAARSDHRVVFAATLDLPTEAYMAMALAAGVHMYTDVRQATNATRVEAGGNLLLVHVPTHGASLVGRCEVRLPPGRKLRVRRANGTEVCGDCDRFTDCEVERAAQVYVLSDGPV